MPFIDRNSAVVNIRLNIVLVNVILRERIEFFPFPNAGSSSADHNLPGPERPCGIQARPKPSFKRLVNVLACKISQKNILTVDECSMNVRVLTIVK
jgi:hypothetical protein